LVSLTTHGSAEGGKLGKSATLRREMPQGRGDMRKEETVEDGPGREHERKMW